MYAKARIVGLKLYISLLFSFVHFHIAKPQPKTDAFRKKLINHQLQYHNKLPI